MKKDIRLRSYSDLPAIDIGWISMKDHFISTVGPNSGRGAPLKNLLVIADAKLKPKTSFPKHPHKDMEILTWVVDGTLHHQDDKGYDQIVPALNLQLMSAGEGIIHAEGNSSDQVLRILQIWIRPKVIGGTPKVMTTPLEGTDLKLLAGPLNAPLIIKQDLWLYAAKIEGKMQISVPEDHFGYLVFIGNLKLDDNLIFDGDGAYLGHGDYEVSGKGQIILIIQHH